MLRGSKQLARGQLHGAVQRRLAGVDFGGSMSLRVLFCLFLMFLQFVQALVTTTCCF
jgi:hypothetical protein